MNYPMNLIYENFNYKRNVIIIYKFFYKEET